MKEKTTENLVEKIQRELETVPYPHTLRHPLKVVSQGKWLALTVEGPVSRGDIGTWHGFLQRKGYVAFADPHRRVFGVKVRKE